MSKFEEWKKLIQQKKYIDAKKIIDFVKKKDILSFIQHHPDMSYNTLIMICISEHFKDQHPVPKLKKCIPVLLSERRFKSLLFLKNRNYQMKNLKWTLIFDALKQIKTVGKLTEFKQLFDIPSLLSSTRNDNDKFDVIQILDEMQDEVANSVLDWTYNAVFDSMSLKSICQKTKKNLCFFRYVSEKGNFVLSQEMLNLLLKNSNVKIIDFFVRQKKCFHSKTPIMELAIREEHHSLVNLLLDTGFDVNVKGDLFIEKVTSQFNLELAYRFVQHGANPFSETDTSYNLYIPNFFQLVIIKKDLKLFNEFHPQFARMCSETDLINICMIMFHYVSSIDEHILIIAKTIQQDLIEKCQDMLDSSFNSNKHVWKTFDLKLSTHILKTRDTRMYDILFRQRVEHRFKYESNVFESAVEREDYRLIQILFDADFYGCSNVCFYCIKHNKLPFLNICQEKTTIHSRILLSNAKDIHRSIDLFLDCLMTTYDGAIFLQTLTDYVEQMKLCFDDIIDQLISSIKLEVMTTIRFRDVSLGVLRRISLLILLLLDNVSANCVSIETFSDILEIGKIVYDIDSPRNVTSELMKTQFSELDKCEFEKMIIRSICQKRIDTYQLMFINSKYKFIHLTKNDLCDLLPRYYTTQQTVSRMMALIKIMYPDIYREEITDGLYEQEYECPICCEHYKDATSYRCVQCKNRFCTDCFYSLAKNVRKSCQYCRGHLTVHPYSAEEELFCSKFGL